MKNLLSFFYTKKKPVEVYNSQELLNRLRKIYASKITLNEVCQMLLEELIGKMKISAGFIMLIKRNKNIWLREVGSHTLPDINEKEFNILIEKSYNASPQRVLVYEKMEECEEKAIMKKYNLHIVLALVAENTIIGAMCFSEKLGSTPYTDEDIALLNVLTTESAIAIRNALSFEELKEFNIILEAEVKKATADLQRANERLQELDKLKDEFVSLASHELRTPMTAIKSYLWMVLNKSQGLSPQINHYILVAYQSTEHLLQLVQNMLTVSRIDAGRVQLTVEQFDLVELIQELYDELKITAEENRLHFLMHSDQKMIFIRGDKEKIREVIQNLIGNAFKFTTSEGTIRTTIYEKDTSVIVKINNTGSYIPPEDLTKLFNKFSRLENTSSSQESRPQGTGLGLYITKQIVEMHKGTIVVDSNKEAGTTFTITLPNTV